MNKVILKGRLTRNPEIRHTGGAKPVCVARFSIACEDRERSRDENGSYPANFIPCVCMGKLAELAEASLCKGKEILICGKMQSGSYLNKEGKKIFTLECLIKELEYCGKKEDTPMNYSNSFMVIPEGAEDELPFR